MTGPAAGQAACNAAARPPSASVSACTSACNFDVIALISSTFILLCTFVSSCTASSCTAVSQQGDSVWRKCRQLLRYRTCNMLFHSSADSTVYGRVSHSHGNTKDPLGAALSPSACFCHGSFLLRCKGEGHHALKPTGPLSTRTMLKCRASTKTLEVTNKVAFSCSGLFVPLSSFAHTGWRSV